MDGDVDTVEIERRRRTGLGLVVLSIFMVFLGCLAALVRDTDEVCFNDYGEAMCAPQRAALIIAVMSVLTIFLLGISMMLSKSFWRGLLTNDDADDGIETSPLSR